MTLRIRCLQARELKPGMEVWIGSAWSSHGMKPGYWFRIEEISNESHWDTGDLIEIGATAYSPDYEVTIR